MSPLTGVCGFCEAVGPVYRVTDDNKDEEYVCVACKRDVEYALSGGRIAQNPGDEA